MLHKDVISYNSMIVSRAMYRRNLDVIELYKEIIRLGLNPTLRTFVGVLDSCSHGALLNITSKVFKPMKNDYELPPYIKHCCYKVDLLSHIECPKVAYDFI